MKRGTKIAIGIGFALVIGIIVYFIVKTVKGDKQNVKSAKKATKAFKLPVNVKVVDLNKFIIK